MEKYCVWQNDIFRVMEMKGYKFHTIAGTKVHPIFYTFIKTRQVGEKFRMDINVDNYEPNSNWSSAKYRLELKEYSNNEKGYINNYWGRTPVVTADSHFYKERTDHENLIRNIKYGSY